MYKVFDMCRDKSIEVFALTIDELVCPFTERCKDLSNRDQRKLNWIVSVSNSSNTFSNKRNCSSQTAAKTKHGDDNVTVASAITKIRQRIQQTATEWRKKLSKNPSFRVNL